MPNPINEFLNENRSEQIHDVAKTNANIQTAYGVYKAVIAGIIFFLLGGFFFIYSSKLVGLGIILAGIVIPYGTYRNRRKEMSYLNRSTAPATTNININAEETLVDSIVGVMATGMGSVTLVIGSAGEKKDPTNAILLTNKNIWFVYVPMPDGDIITEHADVAQFDYLLAKGDIAAKLNEMLAQGGLQAVVNSSAKNHSFALDNLQSVKKSMLGNVEIKTKDGQSVTYGMSREASEKLLSLLQGYITQ